MGKVFWGWVAWFAFLFVLEFTVPCIGFKRVPKVTGSFPFWGLWPGVWGLIVCTAPYISISLCTHPLVQKAN